MLYVRWTWRQIEKPSVFREHSFPSSDFIWSPRHVHGREVATLVKMTSFLVTKPLDIFHSWKLIALPKFGPPGCEWYTFKSITKWMRPFISPHLHEFQTYYSFSQNDVRMTIPRAILDESICIWYTHVAGKLLELGVFVDELDSADWDENKSQILSYHLQWVKTTYIRQFSGTDALQDAWCSSSQEETVWSQRPLQPLQFIHHHGMMDCDKVSMLWPAVKRLHATMNLSFSIMSQSYSYHMWQQWESGRNCRIVEFSC
jgi:hypothetical protein